MPNFNTNQFNVGGAWGQYCTDKSVNVSINSAGVFYGVAIPFTTFDAWNNNVYYDNKGMKFINPDLIGSLFFFTLSATFEGAVNDQLGVKFDLYDVNTDVSEYTLPTIWEGKGGNRWAINHSGILQIKSANSKLNIFCANFSSTDDFTLSNLVVTCHKIT